MVPEIFVETDFAQHRKSGEHICGDAFTSARIPAENRIISVLSDGLGSGVKANILASMTATMALKYAMANKDILRASEVIMDSLPICQVRQISYATFSIIDATLHGRTRIVEQGNPNFLFFRNGDEMPVERRETSTPRWRDRTLLFSEILTRPE
ncbi:MAG: serine/threonine protein phosphatase, partial [Planctomycetes bacterium]|nr:serine/threonine protein phosphatase [Planctomycetota bacterium]